MNKLMKYLLICALSVFLTVPVQSEEWKPNDTVKIVNPWGTSGTANFLCVNIQPVLQRVLKQTVICDQRPSAAGLIGTRQVAKDTKGDGLTLLSITPSNTSTNFVFLEKTGYDTLKDFRVVALIGTVPKTLVARADLPENDINSFIDYLQKNPGKMKQGIVLYTSDHLYSAYFKHKTNSDYVIVNYKNGKQEMLPDVISGRIDFVWENMPTLKPYIRAGKLKPLAVSSMERLPDFPNVPTWGELGFDPIALPSWYGYAVPKDTPDHIVNALNKAFVEALNDPVLKKKLESRNITVKVSSPSESDSIVEKTFNGMKEIGKLAKIQKKK